MVGIIRRNWRTRGYCGSLQPPKRAQHGTGSMALLFCPVERRYPFVRIHTRQVWGPDHLSHSSHLNHSYHLNHPSSPFFQRPAYQPTYSELS